MIFIAKLLLSAFILALASEIAKRSSFIATLLISLPLTSILFLGLLYWDTHSTQAVAEASLGIFWLVLPSLFFFIILHQLLTVGFTFWWALFLSSSATAILYWGYVSALNKFGVKI